MPRLRRTDSSIGRCKSCLRWRAAWARPTPSLAAPYEGGEMLGGGYALVDVARGAVTRHPSPGAGPCRLQSGGVAMWRGAFCTACENAFFIAKLRKRWATNALSYGTWNWRKQLMNHDFAWRHFPEHGYDEQHGAVNLLSRVIAKFDGVRFAGRARCECANLCSCQVEGAERRTSRPWAAAVVLLESTCRTKPSAI